MLTGRGARNEYRFDGATVGMAGQAVRAAQHAIWRLSGGRPAGKIENDRRERGWA